MNSAKEKLFLASKYKPCLFCRKLCLKKDLYDCEEPNCPMCDMCEECAETHKKSHMKETYKTKDEMDIQIMLNSLSGTFLNDKGNNTGLW